MTVLELPILFKCVGQGLPDEQVITDLIRAELETAVDWMELLPIAPLSVNFQGLTHRIN